MINYIANLPSDLRSGGFSSMNVSTYESLIPRYDVHYAGPINPPFSYRQKIHSKLRRIAGLQGDFFFYSEKRLHAIAQQVRKRTRSEAAVDFYHGFTPWILTKPERPYIASSDCSFHDYMEIFHRRELFTTSDLDRIEAAEAAWLKQASLVLLRSQWAADRVVAHYGLDPGRVHTVRSCGEFQLPDADVYEGGSNFVFVSTNFAAKGGHVVVAALQQVRARHPGASLTIIGAPPPAADLPPGVEVTGFLRKEDPSHIARFRDILSRARALVHPTRSDVSPLIIVEAGYFGCPAISSRDFAIPELVDDGVSGRLLADPARVDAVAQAMTWMLERDAEYRAMRLAAWEKTRTHYSRPQFERRVQECMSAVLTPGAAAE